MSSKYEKCYATKDLIYVQHNPAPARPLFKLGNVLKDSLRTLEEIFRKANPPAVHLRMPVRGGIPRETPTGEPIDNPNENFIPIKYIHQYRTSVGAYCIGIPIGIPTSPPSKND